MQQITISPATFKRLESHIKSFPDTPESVINRALDALDQLEPPKASPTPPTKKLDVDGMAVKRPKRTSVGTTGNAKYRNNKLVLEKDENPFRPGSAKHESLEILRTARDRTLTWEQYKELGGRNSHMRSAIGRNFVTATPLTNNQ